MSTRMVVTFYPNGTAEHTLRDDVFRLDGKRKVARLSEILHDDENQGFYIKFLRGPWKGHEVCGEIAWDECGAYLEDVPVMTLAATKLHPTHKFYLFPSYETAVEFEVLLVEGMRKNGISFRE